ncbi:MAG TPA: RNA 2'-phosphotransferase [Ktedonobacterales bacterium]|nr:RNA 2'-phosphotransferase [Ktedonobacterales bacterium]
MEVMEEKRLVKLSKYLSRHLRHQPEALGLTLDPGGWVAVDALLVAMRRNGVAISRADLEEIVARNNKQRFAFDESGQRIRANQGHSVLVDLQLTPLPPPDALYHGTSRDVIGAILRDGLRKMRRHHVHLTDDIATAVKVGRRHGEPVVFRVEAAAMAGDGFQFYRSENGVWLTESVPPRYLRILAPDELADAAAT